MGKSKSEPFPEEWKQKGPPYMVHGDITPGQKGYPTHTHGLSDLKLPEFFIHNNCFGAKDNCIVLNHLFAWLWDHPDEWKKVQARNEIVEVPLWGEGEMIICIRPVLASFAAVKKAYATEEQILESKLGFSQVYVKGDDHALEDRYYACIPDPGETGPCPGSPCAGSPH